MTYFKMGEFEKASYYLNMIENTSEIIAIHTEYMTINQILYNQGKLEKALDVSRYVYRAFPTIPDHVAQYAEMLHNFGHTKKALEIYDKVAGLEKDPSETYLSMAIVCLIWSDPQEADRYFNLAIKTAKENYNAPAVVYADYLRRKGDADRAEKLIKKAIKSGKKHGKKSLSDAYLVYADIFLDRGDIKSAEKYIRMARENHPGYVNIDYTAARFFLKTGDYSGALDILEKPDLKKMAQQDVVFDMNTRKLRIAEVYLAMNKKEKAIKILEESFTGEFPAVRMDWLKYVIPQSQYFNKFKDDKKLSSFLKKEREKLLGR